MLSVTEEQDCVVNVRPTSALANRNAEGKCDMGRFEECEKMGVNSLEKSCQVAQLL